MKNDDLPGPASGGALAEGRELSPDQALALDLVLGILDEPLHTEAIDRCARDNTFSSLVAGYRQMLDRADTLDLSGIDEGAGITPSDDTWAAVAARVGHAKDG